MRTAAEILADRPTAQSVLQAPPDLATRIAALAVRASQIGQVHNPEGHNQYTLMHTPALRFPNGEVRKAIAGESSHEHIYHRLLKRNHPNLISRQDPDVEEGWVDSEGDFHTREQVSRHLGYNADTFAKARDAKEPAAVAGVPVGGAGEVRASGTSAGATQAAEVPLPAHPRYVAALTGSDAKLAEDAFREIRAKVEKGQTSAFVAEDAVQAVDYPRITLQEARARVLRQAEERERERVLAASPQTQHAHSTVQDQAQATYEEGLKKSDAKTKAALLALLLALGIEVYVQVYTQLAPLEGVTPTPPNLRREARRFARGRRRFLKPFVNDLYTALGGPEASPTLSSPDLPADLQRRVQVVAATESQAAYGQAQLRVLQRAGYTTKQWVTVGDDRVRDSHVKCEEQRDIPLGDRFANGLLYPGDPAGGPEEVCNCRCWLEGGSRR